MARKKITDGLRCRSDGLWERSEIIDGKRRWFRGKTPEIVWAKRDNAIVEAQTKQKDV